VEIVKEGAVLGVNVGHPIVTNGTLWCSYSAVMSCNAALPKLLRDFLLIFLLFPLFIKY